MKTYCYLQNHPLYNNSKQDYDGKFVYLEK